MKIDEDALLGSEGNLSLVLFRGHLFSGSHRNLCDEYSDITCSLRGRYSA
jgi:hypothetical protein